MAPSSSVFLKASSGLAPSPQTTIMPLQAQKNAQPSTLPPCTYCFPCFCRKLPTPSRRLPRFLSLSSVSTRPWHLSLAVVSKDMGASERIKQRPPLPSLQVSMKGRQHFLEASAAFICEEKLSTQIPEVSGIHGSWGPQLMVCPFFGQAHPDPSGHLAVDGRCGWTLAAYCQLPA